MKRTIEICVGLSVLASTFACAGDAITVTIGEKWDRASDGQIHNLSRDLALGSQGPQVVAVHDYLMQYGYFPNEDLVSQFPSWQPVMATAPDDPAFYDERMEEAVRQFQSNAGLSETGVVDAETREYLQAPRCGFPEGVWDSGEKFALHGTRWPGTNVTWKLLNANDVSFATAEWVVAAAFNGWSTQTSLTFAEAASAAQADVIIEFVASPPGAPTGPAFANPPPDGRIWLNSNYTWSVANPTPAGSLDLQTVILHEIGHALGLEHSSIAGATMRPSTPTDRTLALDDAVAVSVLYDTWQQLPGLARDIGVGAGGHAWIVGSTGGVHRWTGSTWETVPGAGERIAVEAGGVPWLVNGAGNIYRRNSAAGGSVNWTQQPGCATDIGIGANNAVWITGCGAFGDGYRVFKFNGSGWDQTIGGAVAIAVSETGVPWVVDASGEIYRGTSSASSTGFQKLPSGCARDIGIGLGNYPWIIGCGSAGGFNSGIHVWDEQPATSSGSPPPEKRMNGCS